LLQGIVKLQEKIAGESMEQRYAEPRSVESLTQPTLAPPEPT
jgi:hypothetical protein